MSLKIGVTYRSPEKAAPYLDALRWAGVEALAIRPGDEHPRLDGLLVSGGTDINAELYGEAPHANNDTPDDERDALERALLDDAIARDIPVLCICRGMQLFNIAHGGTLVQHMDGHVQRGVAEAHAIEVAAGTKLAAILGPGKHPVNSRHHQAIGRAGEGLIVSARSTDAGWIEGLERPDRRFAIAVQWHPEDLVSTHEESRALFSAFAKAIGG